MNARLFASVGVLAAIWVLAGCVNPNTAARPKPPDIDPIPVQRHEESEAHSAPAPGVPNVDAAKLLAAKTQNWVDSIAPVAGNQPKRPSSPWDPEQLTLGGNVAKSNPPRRTTPPVPPESPTESREPIRGSLPIADANKPLDLSDADATPAAAMESPPDPTLRKLTQRVKDYPRDVAGQLDYHLLRFVQEQPTPDMNTIAGLPSEDRELLTALLDGLSNFRSTVRADNNLLLSRKVRPILELADRVRAQADLTIPAMALCGRVDGFGRYEPIDSPRLTAGQEHQFILYCEVENFSSQLNDKRMWETRLTLEAVLYTETGLPIWPEKAKATELNDATRRRRHDFFVATRLKLPANLTIGRYLLKVTVVDAQAKRVAESTLPIVVVAK